jgi:hypothetical protein
MLIIQLLATELLSLWFFGWRVGIFAPIALLLVPIWSIQEGNYPLALKVALIDMLFIAIMVFGILKTNKVISGLCLLLFNIISIVLTLASS